MTYKEFVDYNLITEEEFNKAIKFIPDFTIDVDIESFTHGDDIYEYLINCYLYNCTSYAYCSDVNFNTMSFSICDGSEENNILEIIKEFEDKGWTITNKDEYLEENLKTCIIDLINECEDLECLSEIKSLLSK